jgi:hypothetical protein
MDSLASIRMVRFKRAQIDLKQNMDIPSTIITGADRISSILEPASGLLKKYSF